MTIYLDKLASSNSEKVGVIRPNDFSPTFITAERPSCFLYFAVRGLSTRHVAGLLVNGVSVLHHHIGKINSIEQFEKLIHISQ